MTIHWIDLVMHFDIIPFFFSIVLQKTSLGFSDLHRVTRINMSLCTPITVKCRYKTWLFLYPWYFSENYPSVLLKSFWKKKIRCHHNHIKFQTIRSITLWELFFVPAESNSEQKNVGFSSVSIADRLEFIYE